MKIKCQPSAQLLSESAGPTDVNGLPIGHGNEHGQEEAGGWRRARTSQPPSHLRHLACPQNKMRRQYAETMSNQGTRSAIWADYFFVLMSQLFAWVPRILGSSGEEPLGCVTQGFEGKAASPTCWHLPPQPSRLLRLPFGTAGFVGTILSGLLFPAVS